jgi:hypothetical protein
VTDVDHADRFRISVQQIGSDDISQAHGVPVDPYRTDPQGAAAGPIGYSGPSRDGVYPNWRGAGITISFRSVISWTAYATPSRPCPESLTPP